MRRSVAAALALGLSLGILLSAGPATAAVPGYDSAYAGESDFTNMPAGGTGTFSVRFTNTGTVAWARNAVGLLACRDNKVTCNVAPEEAAYATGWYSPTVYATVLSDTAPGSTSFFIYSFTVPAGTPAGTAAIFNGDVGLIATGQTFRPEGYYQVNTTPIVSGGALGISPASGSVRVGGQIQFTATNVAPGGTPVWSVNGGCGVITSSGLLVAVATNAPSQPCAAVVSLAGLTATAAVTVFGNPTSIACAVTPTTAIANGSNTLTVTGTLRDLNGNAVTDDNTTNINFANNTGTLITPTASTAVLPQNGVASRTYTTTTMSGDAQVSLSAPSLNGCTTIFTTTSPGIATKTSATVTPPTIGADNASTARVRVTVQDSSGNTVFTDNLTQLSFIRRTGGASTCNPNTAGPVTVSAGVADLTVTSTTSPGTCTYDITTNNTSIAGTSATLTTVIVGAPHRVAIVSNTSPQTVNNPITVVVELRDLAGARVTNPSQANQLISITHSCTGLQPQSGAVSQTGSSGPDAGRATFTLSSTTTMTDCTVTFSGGTGVNSSTTTVTYLPGPNSGLSCSFSPATIAKDGVAQSTATVRAVDSFANPTNTGSFSTSFTRTSGSGAVLLTTSPRSMTNGAVQFTVRSGTSASVDSFTAAANVNGVAGDETTSCSITMQ